MLSRSITGLVAPKYNTGVTNTNRKLNPSDHTQKLLTCIIVCAVVILAVVIGINVFYFKIIPLSWRVAIMTFVLSLPFSLFLQASLNVEAVKDERHSKIQNRPMYFIAKRAQKTPLR
jgi:hypothetical protein